MIRCKVTALGVANGLSRKIGEDPKTGNPILRDYAEGDIDDFSEQNLAEDPGFYERLPVEVKSKAKTSKEGA